MALRKAQQRQIQKDIFIRKAALYAQALINRRQPVELHVKESFYVVSKKKYTITVISEHGLTETMVCVLHSKRELNIFFRDLYTLNFNHRFIIDTTGILDGKRQTYDKAKPFRTY